VEEDRKTVRCSHACMQSGFGTVGRKGREGPCGYQERLEYMGADCITAKTWSLVVDGLGTDEPRLLAVKVDLI
jgi:hypothetical protein